MNKLFQGRSPIAGWLFPAGSVTAGIAVEQQAVAEEAFLYGLTMADIGILFGIVGTIVMSTITVLRYLKDRDKDG